MSSSDSEKEKKDLKKQIDKDYDQKENFEEWGAILRDAAFNNLDDLSPKEREDVYKELEDMETKDEQQTQKIKHDEKDLGGSQ